MRLGVFITDTGIDSQEDCYNEMGRNGTLKATEIIFLSQSTLMQLKSSKFVIIAQLLIVDPLGLSIQVLLQFKTSLIQKKTSGSSRYFEGHFSKHKERIKMNLKNNNGRQTVNHCKEASADIIVFDVFINDIS